MALEETDKEYIRNEIQAALQDFLRERSQPPGNAAMGVVPLDLYERVVRVEEELKHQRELMVQGFELMEKRFEQVDKRFEQVDKRFEQTDKRIEGLEHRMENLIKRMDRFMVWSFATTVSVGGLVVALIKLL